MEDALWKESSPSNKPGVQAKWENVSMASGFELLQRENIAFLLSSCSCVSDMCEPFLPMLDPNLIYLQDTVYFGIKHINISISIIP